MAPKINPLRDPENIAFAGDWHENTPYGRSALDVLAADNVDTIIHAGDFGYDYSDDFVGGLNERLQAHDQILLFVDGNHENFPKLYQYPIHTHYGLRKLTNRIWHIPRGFRWTWWDSVTFMGVGGAASVDKAFRQPYRSWWPEEEITAGDVYAATEDTSPVDIFISHDVSYEVDIPRISKEGPNDSQWPDEAITRARAHRHQLSAITNVVQPWMIVHGHYHYRYINQFQYENGFPCTVQGLAEDGTIATSNLLAFTKDKLIDAARTNRLVRETLNKEST